MIQITVDWLFWNVLSLEKTLLWSSLNFFVYETIKIAILLFIMIFFISLLMLASFGMKITLAYIASGLIIGVFSGLIVDRMNLEKYLEKDIQDGRAKNKEKKFTSLNQRFNFGVSEAYDITKKLILWIMLGISVGVLIHNFVPDAIIHNYISKAGIFAVPIATILGVPLYGSCAAIIPIAQVLFQKGVPLGTAMAFLMSISALSLPEAVILRRVMKLKLIFIFFTIVSLGIIIIGYFLNAVQKFLV